MLKDAVTAQTVPPPEAVPLSKEAWASNDLGDVVAASRAPKE